MVYYLDLESVIKDSLIDNESSYSPKTYNYCGQHYVLVYWTKIMYFTLDTTFFLFLKDSKADYNVLAKN